MTHDYLFSRYLRRILAMRAFLPTVPKRIYQRRTDWLLTSDPVARFCQFPIFRPRKDNGFTIVATDREPFALRSLDPYSVLQVAE
jgi:hypothetical protein